MEITPYSAARIILPLSVAVLAVLNVRAQSTFVFALPTVSCPMAHCTMGLTDSENTVVFSTAPVTLTQDMKSAGSGSGLGASSNGVNSIAASYRSSIRALVVYDQNGHYRWDSGSLLDATSMYSAPIVGQSGSVIMADDHNLGFFNPDGSIFAMTPTPGGTPISPVTTQNGSVVLVTSGGPVSVYSLATGALLGSLYPQDPGNPNYYDTLNTPCVVQNRVYVSMALRSDPNNTGRLYAFDIDPANASMPIAVAWYYTFGGPSGASPLCSSNVNGYATVVSFDGDHAAAGNVGGPTIYTVADGGTSGVLQWKVPVHHEILANMPYDRGGLWYFVAGEPVLDRLNLSNGTLMQSIGTNTMLGSLPSGSRAVPASAMSMATDTNGDPAMILSLQVSPVGTGASYLASINTVSGTLNWTMMIAPNDSLDRTHGQFPVVVDSTGRTRVAFTTFASGLRTAAAQ